MLAARLARATAVAAAAAATRATSSTAATSVASLAAAAAAAAPWAPVAGVALARGSSSAASSAASAVAAAGPFTSLARPRAATPVGARGFVTVTPAACAPAQGSGGGGSNGGASDSASAAAGGAGVATEPEETTTTAAAGGAATGVAGDAAAAATKALTDEVNKLKAANAELASSRLMLLAEMENVRRIASRDVETAKAYALQSFSKRLLDVVDNLGRAVESVPADMRGKREGHEVLANLYEGVAATHREMMKTLAQFGITPFGAKGDRFDPNRHEAMMQVPATAETPADSVAMLLKQGFTLKERVLRPAQVAVAVKADGSA